MEKAVLSPRKRHRVEEAIRGLFLKFKPELVFTVGVDIVFHRNRRTLVSWSRKDAHGALRLHEIFAQAPEDVLEAVVRHFFTSIPRQETRKLRSRIMDFVDENRRATLGTDHLPRVRPPQGRVYDLDQVRQNVTQHYVRERLHAPSPPQIGWSYRKTPSLMGKWIEGPAGHPNLIVINRLLDDRKVPLFYVEYIVYHEILHDLFPIRRQAGRWVHHPVEFRRRERTFPRYNDARRWEAEELPELLKAGRARR